MNTDTIKPPAKPKPTAQTVLKALGFQTYTAYFLAQRHRRATLEQLNDNTRKATP